MRNQKHKAKYSADLQRNSIYFQLPNIIPKSLSGKTKYKNINTLKYKQINNELVNNLINDLDKTLREIGIGDMSIGKYVKKYVKKFYYRLSIIDKNLNNSNSNELSLFLKNLDFINNDHLEEVLKKIYSKYNEIKSELKNEFI